MKLDRRTVLGAAGGAVLASVAERGKASPVTPMRRIAVEEAFAIPEQLAALKALTATDLKDADVPFWRMVTHNDTPFTTRIRRQLLDLDEERIAIMDANGVDMQVLSLTSPGVQMFRPDEAVAMARLANDRLAQAIARHPDRFAGLITIAPQAPAEAAKEIERGMTRLCLNGVMINSHTFNEYLDEEKFLPIFEAASALNAPIYIHPRAPSAGMAEPFMKHKLETAIWGYGAETGLHGVRLIVSGLFDRFPDLRIVLGHMGEGIPFWLWRIDYMHGASATRKKFGKTPSEIFKDNFAITTSGMNWPLALDFCRQALGPDNIMWAIDYPYQDSPGATQFMNNVAVPDSEKSMIFSGNAERIFNIGPR